MSDSAFSAGPPPSRLSFRIALEPAHLLRARERIRDYLLAYCEDSRITDEVVLCIEEACTNAIRHSDSADPMQVTVEFEDGSLVAKVKDAGGGFDVARFDPAVLPDLMATGGRGLYLMAHLMDHLELRNEDGIEVRMVRRGVNCRPAPPLDAALGEGRSAAGESRTRSMLEDVSEAFVAVDWEYRVSYANAAALRLSGRPRDELTGRSVLDTFPSLTDSALATACQEAMELGSPAIVEHRSARIGWLEARIYPTSSGISVYLREINERKRREAEREEYLEELRERVRLGESQEVVNQLVHSTLGIDSIIRRALEAGSRALGAEAASVEMREAGRWLVRFQRGLSAEALGAELKDAEAPLANRASVTREPVVIEDIRAEPELDVGIVGHYGIRSCLVVPLVARGEVEGCLLFHYMRPHQFSDAAVDYAKKFGSAVSLALENARLRGREGERARLRTSLAEGRLGRLIEQSRVHPIRVLLVACLAEAAFLSIIGVAQDTREVFGLPGSLMALTVVVAGALAGSLVGVSAAVFGGLVFYIMVADAGAKSTAEATLLSTAIWIAAAVISSLLAGGLRSQAERRRAASVALARAEAEREAQMTERERIEALARDLDAEREQLRTIIEQTDNSIVLLDREFNFVLVNSAYATRWGYEPEAMVGLNHFDLYPHEENEAIFRRVRDTGEAVEYRAKPFVLPDQPGRGATYWDWHLSATKDDAGEVDGLVFSLVEVTERVRAQQLSDALNTINSVVNARLDPDRAMEEVLRLTGEALECEAGTVVVAATEGELIARQVWNMREDLIGRRLTPSELPSAGRALAGMQPVFSTEQPAAVEEILPHFLLHQARGRLAIPLGVADEKLGVLVFAWSPERRRYGQAESDFAEKVGAIVSQALENSRLYEEQRHVARTLQEHLVHRLPVIEGIEFGRVSLSASSPALVGGDFSDVFALDDSRVAVLIGDVAGKGLQAAGLTETVHTAVSSYALVEASPGSVLGKTNELLLKRSEEDDQYVTAFLAVVDRGTGDVAYASAGHPPPVRFGSSLGLLQVDSGMPLGTFVGGYPTHHLTLLPGDGLVLYTDGVTEAKRDGELYGEARLAAFVAALRGCHPKTLAEKLSEDATAFGGTLKDDMQILAFRLEQTQRDLACRSADVVADP